jgi:hypothetical protein
MNVRRRRHQSMNAKRRWRSHQLAIKMLVATRVLDFERRLSRALFGSDTEPSFDDIRQGARNALLGAFPNDPSAQDAVRAIWDPEVRRRRNNTFRKKETP